MIAEAGLAALWAAAALSLLQLLLGLGPAALRADNSPIRAVAVVRPVAVVQGLLTLSAFLLLIWLFVVSDMSVKLVASHSASTKPMLYKVAETVEQ